MGRGVRLLLVLALFWLGLAAFLAFQFWPRVPHSVLQWVLFIALGPPLYLLGEAFFEWLFSRKHGHAISPHRFSVKRILFALLVLVSLCALSWWSCGASIFANAA